MQVSDIMTKDVLTVQSDDPIDLVARILIENRIHGIPVVDAEKKLVGIVTEVDFFAKKNDNYDLLSYIDFIKRKKSSGNLSKEEKERIVKLINSSVKDIMSDKCVAIFPDDGMEKLLETFRETRLTSIPVIGRDGILAGIVARSDVIRTIRL